MIRQLGAKGRWLVQGVQSPVGSAMVLSAVIHLAALPLLADWNPGTTTETERKVALLELTPQEQQQLPAFAREVIPSQPSGPGSDIFSRLGLGSAPRSSQSPEGKVPLPRNDSLLWPDTGSSMGSTGSDRGATGRRWDSGAGDYQGWDSLYGRGGWQMDSSGTGQTGTQGRSRRSTTRRTTGNRGQGTQGRSTSTTGPKDSDFLGQAIASIAVNDLRAKTLDAAASQALASALNAGSAGEEAGNYAYNAALVGDRAVQGRLGGVADWVQKVADLPMRGADGKLLPGTRKEINGSFRDMIQVGDGIQKNGVPIQWRQFADLRLCAAIAAQPPHLIRLAALVGDQGKLAAGLNPVRLVESSGYPGIDNEAIAFLMQALQGKTLADRPGYLIHLYTLTYPACGTTPPAESPSPSPTTSPAPGPAPSPTTSPAPGPTTSPAPGPTTSPAP